VIDNNIRKKIFFRRFDAYKRLFNLDNRDAEVVLSDLRQFCRPTGSIFSNDPLEMALMEGRRQVFLRIEEMTALERQDIYHLTEDIGEEYE
jgi:hypothetical protein